MNNKNNIDVTLAPASSPVRTLAGVRRGLRPLVGLGSVMLLSWLMIGAFEASFFASWVTFCVVCAVPVQIILSMLWCNQYPGWLGRLGQPARGLAQTGLTLAGGAFTALAVWQLQAGGVVAPTPFTLMYAIFCVLLTFWLVIVWEGWPLAAFVRHPLWLGLGILALAWLGGYRLFTWLFDFAAMAPAPFYHASLDPHGAVPAFTMLAFAVTTVSVTFAGVLLGFWPLPHWPALVRQPLAGLARSVWVLFTSAVLYGGATWALAIEPVPFMVHGAIALLFGTLVPMLVFEGRLCASWPQPWRGAGQLLVALIAAAVLPTLYWHLEPWISGPLASGAPGYDKEFWLASALLAMTFPLLVIHTRFLDGWPLRRP